MRRTRIVDVSPLADAALLAVIALPPTVTNLSPLARLPIYADLVGDEPDAEPDDESDDAPDAEPDAEPGASDSLTPRG
jgi:hypothetical protein